VEEWGLAAGGRLCLKRCAVAVLLALALSCVAAGCGGSASVDKSEVTLKVRSEGSPERKLLNQIYAQALKIAGYRVKDVPEAFETKVGLEGLQAKQIDGYPQYISTALFYDFGVEIEDIPTQTKAAYRELERNLEKQKLTAFPPAPYNIENAVGMLRTTAEEQGLEKNSDLKGKAEKMTVKGPTYCHVSVECLGGIERHYDTAFESISYEKALTPELTWWRGESDWRYEVLEKGESDASFLYNTDGRLTTEGKRFVILADDRNIFPASNFVWVTSDEVVEEAGPDYEKAIVDAQEGLTLEVIRQLNAKLEQGSKPAEVAAEYLRSIRYTG
jgi:osmoprotectant transport system substrate-binding protein